MKNEMTAGEAAEKLEYKATLFPGMKDELLYAASILRRVASGELAEVVHAHWIHAPRGNDYFSDCLKCSACGYELADDEVANKGCPNCRALMDESDVRQTHNGKDDSHETD